MLRVTVFFNEKQIHSLETDKEVVSIGRWDANDVHIDNVGISKVHAKIRREFGVYLLEDCESTNGTFVNGEQITKARLSSGTVVNIGKFALVCEVRDQVDSDLCTAEAPSLPTTIKS